MKKKLLKNLVMSKKCCNFASDLRNKGINY